MAYERKKTLEELITEYTTKGIRPRANQFDLREIVRFANSHDGKEFTKAYRERRYFIEKNGVKKVHIEKADKKYLCELFRDTYFPKLERTANTKSVELTDEEKDFLELENELIA